MPAISKTVPTNGSTFFVLCTHKQCLPCAQSEKGLHAAPLHTHLVHVFNAKRGLCPPCQLRFDSSVNSQVHMLDICKLCTCAIHVYCHDVIMLGSCHLCSGLRLESKQSFWSKGSTTYIAVFCGVSHPVGHVFDMDLKPGSRAQSNPADLNASCLHQRMTPTVQASCHRVAIPAAFATPVPSFFIRHDPLQLFQWDAGVTCNRLQTNFLAAATSGHQVLIAINAADITQVIRRQLSIMLWAQA